MTTLIIECEGATRAQVELPPGEYSLGADSGNAIVIDHPTVSHHHCDLVIQPDGQALVRDAGSTNGTWLANEPVGLAVLKPGQSFQAGAARITLDHSPLLPPPLPGALRSGAARMAPAASLEELPPPRAFFQELPDAFSYPFREEAYLYIVVVAGLGLAQVLIPDFTGLIGLFIGLVIGCYIARLWQQIVLSTIDGKDQLPEFLQAGSDWREDFFFYLRLIALNWICFSPAFFWNYAQVWDWNLPAWTIYLCYGFSCFYLPMALLAFLITDSLAVLNPVFILRSIFRKLSDYLLLVFLLGLFLGAGYLVSRIIEPSVPAGHRPPSLVLTALTGALTGAIGLYLSLAWMRLLGLFYRHHQDRLGWSI